MYLQPYLKSIEQEVEDTNFGGNMVYKNKQCFYDNDSSITANVLIHNKRDHKNMQHLVVSKHYSI